MTARGCLRDDEGVTLVELLVAVAMMGVAFVVIVGGMFTYSLTSGQHRTQADVQLELRRYAEAVSNVTAVPNAPGVGPYTACATTYANTYVAPSGFTPGLSVKLWNPSTLAFDITPTAGCTDPGLQRVRVTISVTGPYAYSESLDVVLRQP